MASDTGNKHSFPDASAREEGVTQTPIHNSNSNEISSSSQSGFQTPRTDSSSPVLNDGQTFPVSTKSKRTPIIDVTKDLWALTAKQMRATPNAIALEDEITTLTYAELDQRVALLANQLRDHGVGRDKLVGVLLGRSANYVIACLAALRAGGAFLVLELAYPPNLLADVIEDAKPTVVITNKTQANQIDAEIPLIVLDDVGMGHCNPPGSKRRSRTCLLRMIWNDLLL